MTSILMPSAVNSNAFSSPTSHSRRCGLTTSKIIQHHQQQKQESPKSNNNNDGDSFAATTPEHDSGTSSSGFPTLPTLQEEPPVVERKSEILSSAYDDKDSMSLDEEEKRKQHPALEPYHANSNNNSNNDAIEQQQQQQQILDDETPCDMEVDIGMSESLLEEVSITSSTIQDTQLMKQDSCSHNQTIETKNTNNNDEIESNSQQQKQGKERHCLPNFHYGGLNNLGNTCYMNSAMQMLASLDGFLDALKPESPMAEQSKLELREAFIDTLVRLQNGETVRPEDFKSKMDDRSSLFLGYRQQDSHEFLTSLLDLLDEDYKQQQQQQDDDNEEKDDNELPTTYSPQKRDSSDTISSLDDTEVITESTNAQDESQPQSSQCNACKKQRKNDQQAAETDDDTPPSPLQPTTSYKDLQFSDIEQLLHGKTSNNSNESLNIVSVVGTTATTSPTPPEPRCKLVGGRMHTSGLVLRSPHGESITMGQHDSLLQSEQQNTDPQDSEQQQQEQEEAIEENNENDNEGSPTPVDSYFKTKTRVRLTCDSCKYSRTHEETFLHLSLEIGANSGSVEDGIRKFFLPEKREIKCEKCFCPTATQTMEITSLPRAMLLHFKRFIVDISPDYTSITYRKNQSPVIFDDHLSLEDNDTFCAGVLSEFLAPDVRVPDSKSVYQIRSIVNHIGSSASCGHYTATSKRMYENEQRIWTKFNDSSVSKLSSTDVVENPSRTAYMIMYELE